MSDINSIQIPLKSGSNIPLNINSGETIFLVGRNGSGKSSLLTNIYIQAQSKNISTVKIIAHRQNWFPTEKLQHTRSTIDQHSQYILDSDKGISSRYTDIYQSSRIDRIIYHTINSQHKRNKRVTDAVENGNVGHAVEIAHEASDLSKINELLYISNQLIKIDIEEDSIFCKITDTQKYGINKLSDGERAIFLLSAEVLTAPKNSLILIDEPERHLYQSISQKLLTRLFEFRSDCAFVISTHDLKLAHETPQKFSFLVRGCTYENDTAIAWDIDTFDANIEISDDLKRDILGSRKNILYVEGDDKKSPDLKLYEILFPSVTIIPRDTCVKVETSVSGLSSESHLHWISAWGIIDNDQRPTDEIEKLWERNIFVLPYYSIESLYYHPEMIEQIAQIQANLQGLNAEILARQAISDAVNIAKEDKENLIKQTATRIIRSKIMNNLPNKNNDFEKDINIHISVNSVISEENEKFEKLILEQNFEKIITSYPIKKSRIPKTICNALSIPDTKNYERMVQTKLRTNPDAATFLRKIFSKLLTEIEPRQQLPPP